jgi:hypothetical protein
MVRQRLSWAIKQPLAIRKFGPDPGIVSKDKACLDLASVDRPCFELPLRRPL